MDRLAALLFLLFCLCAILGMGADLDNQVQQPHTSALRRVVQAAGVAPDPDWGDYPTPGPRSIGAGCRRLVPDATGRLIDAGPCK